MYNTNQTKNLNDIIDQARYRFTLEKVIPDDEKLVIMDSSPKSRY